MERGIGPIISFAHLTPALTAGAKSVTRRTWNHRQGIIFHNLAGDPDRNYAQAWNFLPRTRNRTAEQVASIRILSCVREPVAEMPDADYDAEGFRYLHDQCVRALPDYAFGAVLPPGGIAIRHGLLDLLSASSWAGFNRWRSDGGMLWTIRFELVHVFNHRGVVEYVQSLT
jgi:hypothetical protein